jgi:hypothetical protein
MKKSLGLCCVFLLASCGSDPGPVAGGGSDQPNKIQAVRFLTQDGQPAAGARVVTWSGTWDPVHSKQTTHRLDSGLTDQNGQWKVIVPESDWYVSAELEDQIAICPSSQREAVFGRVSSIRGRVVALNGIVVDSIWMGGAGDAFRLQSTGAFQLSTQVGPRRIWGRVHWNGGMDTLLLAEKFLDTSAKFFLNLVADTGSVLLVSAESYPNIASLRGQLFHSSDANSPKAFDDVPSKPIAVEEGKTLLADSIRYFRWKWPTAPRPSSTASPTTSGSLWPIGASTGQVWKPCGSISLPGCVACSTPPVGKRQAIHCGSISLPGCVACSG